MGKFPYALLAAIILISGCAMQPVQETFGDEKVATNAIESVSFKTADGFAIIGSLTKSGNKAAILMHQLGRDKGTYLSFAKKLADSNITSLAIDLRGHGASIEQNAKRRPFTSFKDQDFRDMEKDAQAAKKFLEERGYSVEFAVGSSIGANTALNFAAHDNTIKKIVLLSPGLNYKGIETQGAAAGVKAKTLLVASSGDDEYSFASAKALAEEIPGSEFMQMRNAGHGTFMFSGTFLEDDIVKWLLQD